MSSPGYRTVISYAYGMAEKKKPKKKSLPHIRAIQRDRSKRVNSRPPDEEVVAWMEAVVHSAVYGQLDAYYAMGLRARVLTLPVMTAFVLGMLWRQLGFTLVDQLTEQDVGFVTRPKSNTKIKDVRILSKTAQIHDTIIILGSG